jgi:anti-sigma-K factor RskA
MKVWPSALSSIMPYRFALYSCDTAKFWSDKRGVAMPSSVTFWRSASSGSVVILTIGYHLCLRPSGSTWPLVSRLLTKQYRACG